MNEIWELVINNGGIVFEVDKYGIGFVINGKYIDIFHYDQKYELIIGGQRRVFFEQLFSIKPAGLLEWLSDYIQVSRL